MRQRILSSSLVVLLIAGLAIALHTGSPVRAQQDAASPTAGDATPEATAEPARTEVVTLVAWYAPDGDVLRLGPIRTNNSLVAGPETGNDRAVSGKVDFEADANDGQPRITLGDSAFNAYAVNPDDPETLFRWVYTNDDPEARPATLVLQIEATKGPYKGYAGTATFISRANDSTGVIVIVLNPPS